MNIWSVTLMIVKFESDLCSTLRIKTKFVATMTIDGQLWRKIEAALNHASLNSDTL